MSYDPVEVSLLAPAELGRARDAGLAAFAAAADLAALHDAEVAHLGNRAPVSLANREIGALPPQARADAGRRVRAVLVDLRAAAERRRAELSAERDRRVLEEEAVDVTLPWRRGPIGARHPLTEIRERVADVFVGLGYEIAEGPEAETEWHNFDALNLHPDHPARTESDTFFLAPAGSGRVLRTHTSPVQVRALLERGAPCYVACPGRTYRTDELDATHTPVFSQVEVLAVDRGLTMADLRGTLDAFARAMFGPGQRTRFVPDNFPFTEPSAQMELLCLVCGGDGCRTCAGTGWIEWGGAGMVHPVVLASAGVDPAEFTGFAFGMGLDRTLMFRHEVADVRDLLEGDVRLARALGGGL